jgi:pyruvate/2-oxoglutarate dehydrogenase complex dihydrolipoamide acyltransferase (E2) component
MPFWYFFTIPDLPREVAHQSNQVQVQEYLSKEGDPVEPGTPVALIENYWAVMRLKANGQGILRKTFFTPGTQVKIGDPIGIIGAEGENLPHGEEWSVLEIVKMKGTRPQLKTSNPVFDRPIVTGKNWEK